MFELFLIIQTMISPVSVPVQPCEFVQQAIRIEATVEREGRKNLYLSELENRLQAQRLIAQSA